MCLMTIGCGAYVDNTNDIMLIKNIAKMGRFDHCCVYTVHVPASIDIKLFDSCGCYNVGDTIVFKRKQQLSELPIR